MRIILSYAIARAGFIYNFWPSRIGDYNFRYRPKVVEGENPLTRQIRCSIVLSTYYVVDIQGSVGKAK